MDIVIAIYIFTGLFIFMCLLTLFLFNKVLDLKEELRFQQKLMHKLNEIKSLDELNDTQRNFRHNVLASIANSREELLLLENKFDLEKTKKLFFNFLEPIDITLWERIVGRLNCIVSFKMAKSCKK